MNQAPPPSAPRHCGRKQDVGRERRGEKPAVRGRAGAANGERGRRRARRGGGGGALFLWGPRVGRAQRQSGAELRGGSKDKAAGRRARGGERVPGEARRADGGGERSAQGRGSRRPRRRRQLLLLLEEPRGHRPCLRPCRGHRCSPEAPRGLASVKVSGGWGSPLGGGPRRSRAAPRARPSPEARSRAGLGVTPSGPLLPGAAPPRALATLGRGRRPGAAEVRLPASFPSPPLPGVSRRCVEASGVWGRGRGGGEGSGVTRRLLPPPPPHSGASFLRRGRPVTPALLQAGRGRAADRPGRRWRGGCFLMPQEPLAFDRGSWPGALRSSF
ncbi:translation initiation factor IF-2-like [Mustela erminea]|uniref:translation initiation factor IF-2-like n=1 Tax=Mustela erminea TaxID=36723 RepID=UPI001386F530|nr:translation initiation factor IF-2-like [Mustela erminea]